jgi:DNA-binding beta-propeller fold protein YncE
MNKLCLWLLATTFCLSLSGVTRATEPSEQKSVTISNSVALPFRETHVPLHSSVARLQINSISGVAVGADGLFYVIQRESGTDPILVFDKRGNLLRSWGKGDFTLPHSLRLDPSGNVWAVDAGSSRLMEYSSAGKKLLTIAVKPLPDTGSPFRGITDLAFAPNGHLFITDGYGNARILEYTASGVKLREWGREGTGPGEFHLPHAIQIGPDGIIYVADRENGRIEKFDPEGKFLGAIDHLGRCYAGFGYQFVYRRPSCALPYGTSAATVLRNDACPQGSLSPT